MNGTVLYFVVGMLMVGGFAAQFLISRRRHRRDHREDLIPILAAHGLTFVSARWPGFFKVGPFPKFGIEVGRPQSRIGGIYGEYDEYRVVTVKNSEGKVYQLWAKLEFELFKLHKVSWRWEIGQEVSTQVKGLAEN